MSNSGFKKSLFGFSSRSVLEYIEQQQSQSVAEREQLCARISQLEAELGAATKLADIKTSENSNLTAEVEMLRSRVNVQDSELEQLRREQAESADIRAKAGDIFIEARSSANNIIDSARQSANEMRRSAGRLAETAVESIGGTYEQLDSLRETMRATFDDFCRRLADMSIALDTARSEIIKSSPAVEPPSKPASERRVIRAVSSINKAN